MPSKPKVEKIKLKIKIKFKFKFKFFFKKSLALGEAQSF
jgi:hypothetical protein